MAPWETGNMPAVIAKLQESRSIYFRKLLARLPHRKFGQSASLVVPMLFVRDHGDKFEEWSILRTQSSSKAWRVRIRILKNKLPQVRFLGGWKHFSADNRLKEGDSLVFVLNVNARSEFQVYIFPGTGPSSSNPQTAARKRCSNIDRANLAHRTEENSCARKRNLRSAGERNIRETGDLSIDEEKATEERWPVQTRHENLEEQNSLEQNSRAASEVLTGTESKGLASKHGTDSLPNFQKRITATNIRHGRIEVPASFLKAHIMQLTPRADHVEVQGIHRESPVQTLTCYWVEQGESWRLYFLGLSRFLKENDLHKDQELQFTLTAASFFVVRKV